MVVTYFGEMYCFWKLEYVSIFSTIPVLSFLNGYCRNCSFSENACLIKLLLRIVSCLHAELADLSFSSSNQQYADNGTRVPRCCNNLWEVQTDAFVMMGDVLSKNGSSLSVEMWQSTLEVCLLLTPVVWMKSN